MRKHNQFGFAHPLLFVVLLLIIAVVAFAGWRVWQSQDGDPDDETALSPTSVPCEGRLYDSHAHPDDPEIVNSLPGIMTTYDVGCSVLFTQMNLDDMDDSLEIAREDYGNFPGRIAIFYDVIEDDPSKVTRSVLDTLWQKSGGKFNGFGEFAFYEESFSGRQLTDDGWSVLFEFAGEKGLPIMIHPQQDMLASLETMLDRYPDTNVIVHGFELPDQMPKLLKDHANLYFTLDTATLFVLGELTPESIPEHLFYPGGGPNTGFDVDEFVAKYDAKRSEILSQAVDKWLPVLLAAPDKVMWGTDISLAGHVDGEVYKRVIDLTNEFAKEIPDQYRQGYLRDNAFKLIGEGVTLN